jgi:hypothetical protein
MLAFDNNSFSVSVTKHDKTCTCFKCKLCHPASAEKFVEDTEKANRLTEQKREEEGFKDKRYFIIHFQFSFYCF